MRFIHILRCPVEQIKRGETSSALIQIFLTSRKSYQLVNDAFDGLCILVQASLSVRLNMSEPNNCQALSPTQEARLLLPKGSSGRYTGETLLRTRPRTYRKVVALLADPDWSVVRIAQACKVSENTIAAVRLREASTIEERKKTLTSVLVDVATEQLNKWSARSARGSLRDVTVAMGVSTDKVLALLGETPSALSVEVTLGDREKVSEIHARLVAELGGDTSLIA